MNRQVNSNHCYKSDDHMYMLAPVPNTPEWWVMRDGRRRRTFTSLAAAKGWLGHVLDHPQSDKERNFVPRGYDQRMRDAYFAARPKGTTR